MNLQWDYSKLAQSYVKRPPYAGSAIQKMFDVIGHKNMTGPIADIGAGTAHLTLELAELNIPIMAVEPNDEMRKIGQERTSQLSHISWSKATAENTMLKDKHFSLVTFGSSFNVTDRLQALRESHRILKSGGWFACMWNHRDLTDVTQAKIEEIIKSFIPNYDYGARREDQTQIISQSGLFDSIELIEGEVLHTLSLKDAAQAWSSHGTLERQAKEKFPHIVREIDSFLQSVGETIHIPYKTKIWVAKKKELSH